MRTSEACPCGASFSGSPHNWRIWRKAHGCVIEEAEGKPVYGGDSVTEIQTQDGRWLYDREIPNV